MKCFLAQDLTTLSVASGRAVTQAEPYWVDLAGYRETFVWADIRRLTAGTSLVLQSAVTKDESLFVTLATVSPASPTLTIVSAIPELTTPVSRWFRWQLTPPAGSSGDMTFRLWVVANRSTELPGRRNHGLALSHR